MRSETEAERPDRNWNSLLQELRVTRTRVRLTRFPLDAAASEPKHPGQRGEIRGQSDSPNAETRSQSRPAVDWCGTDVPLRGPHADNGDQDPNPLGQPSGFPPPRRQTVYRHRSGAGYPPPPPPPGTRRRLPGFGAPPRYAPPRRRLSAADQSVQAPRLLPRTPRSASAIRAVCGSGFGARFIDGFGVGIVAYLISLAFRGNSRYFVAGVFGGLLTYAYFALREPDGPHPGKMLLGLSVHGPGGAPKPTVQQSATRNAFLLLNLIPCHSAASVVRRVDLHRGDDREQSDQAGQATNWPGAPGRQNLVSQPD